MLRKITGSETEYGLYELIPESRYRFKSVREVERVTSAEFNNGTQIEKTNGFFLYNGGRFFREQDGGTSFQTLGYTPEYSTPECRSIRDLIIWEKAGDLIMNILYGLDDEFPSLLVTKCGQGFWYEMDGREPLRISSGHHENYSVNMPGDEFRLSLINKQSMESRKLMSFLVSRVILNGAGFLNTKIRPIPFEISSRREFIVAEFGENTATCRPVVFTGRSKDNFGLPNMSRIQIIMGDHNMSEISIYLTFGTTALVLRMLEEGFLKDCPLVKNGVTALAGFSGDISLKASAELLNNLPGTHRDYATAIEIQNFFCQKAGEFIASHENTAEERQVQACWQDVLTKLNQDIFSLNGELDWVTKYSLIQSYLKKNRKSFTDLYPGEGSGHFQLENCVLKEKCIGLDFGYHNVSAKGFYNKLLSSGKIKRLVSDQEIERAVYEPPQNTRAKIRSDFCRFVVKNRLTGLCTDDWSSIQLINLNSGMFVERIDIGNPFENKSEIWENMKKLILKRLEANAKQ